MNIFIHSVDLETIRAAYDFFPISGVFTDPGLLAQVLSKEESPYSLLKRIRDFIGYDQKLFVQVLSTYGVDMVNEAFRIREHLGEHTYITIPSNAQGIKAIQILHGLGFRTAAMPSKNIFLLFLAAKAGADYICADLNLYPKSKKVQKAEELQKIVEKNSLSTQVLVGPLETEEDISNLLSVGLGAVNIDPKLFKNLAETPTEKSTSIRALENIYGEGISMKDFLV